MKLQVSESTIYGSFEVHVDGCSDVDPTAVLRRVEFVAADYPSRLAVSAAVWGEQIAKGRTTAEEGLELVDFKPCCQGLPLN